MTTFFQLIFVSLCCMTFSLQARYADSVPGDISTRVLLAGLSLLVLLCPDSRIATVTCVPVLLLIGYWLVTRRDTFYARGEGPEPEIMLCAISSAISVLRRLWALVAMKIGHCPMC